MDLTLIAKAFTWKILSTLATWIIAYVMLGDVSIASSIAGVEFVVKMVLFYLHEKMWINYIDYVRAKDDDRETMG